MKKIDVENLINTLKEEDASNEYSVADVVKMLEHVPEIIGHWEYRRVNDSSPFFRDRYYCSACGGWNTYGMTDYCPECGARMHENIKQE